MNSKLELRKTRRSFLGMIFTVVASCTVPLCNGFNQSKEWHHVTLVDDGAKRTEYFDGKIKKVTLYDRVLNSNEISQMSYWV